MIATMTPEEFATPEDIAAVRPDVPLQTIRRHLRNGTIPGARKVGRSWVVPVAAAAEYVRTYERYARNDVGPDTSPPAVSDPASTPPEKEER